MWLSHRIPAAGKVTKLYSSGPSDTHVTLKFTHTFRGPTSMWELATKWRLATKLVSLLHLSHFFSF